MDGRDVTNELLEVSAPKRDRLLSTTVDADFEQKVKDAAAACDRSVSGYVRWVVGKAIGVYTGEGE
jgi:hypothetical protein